MAINQSFTGNVVNPITDARLHLGISSAGLAKRLGLSKQYLSKAEQGSYSSLNPSLRRWVSSALNLSPEAIDRRYAHFQSETRKSTLANIGPAKLVRHMNDNRHGYQIFEAWRSGYWPSGYAFAQAFCVHPEMVRKYEEGITPEMPALIQTILTDAGLMDTLWIEIGKHPNLARLETY